MVVRPHRSVVIVTAESLGVSNNVMGIVTGKGRYIFQSAIVSTGKIDPGYDGPLKIGFFNGGERPIVLRRGEAFCSCCFVATETEAESPRSRTLNPRPNAKPIPSLRRIWRSLVANWNTALTLLIALAALAVSILNGNSS